MKECGGRFISDAFSHYTCNGDSACVMRRSLL